MKAALSKAEARERIELYRRGFSLAAIAREQGVSTTAIRLWLGRHGILDSARHKIGYFTDS